MLIKGGASHVDPGTLLRDTKSAGKAETEVVEILRALDPRWRRFAVKALRELLDAVKPAK